MGKYVDDETGYLSNDGIDRASKLINTYKSMADYGGQLPHLFGTFIDELKEINAEIYEAQTGQLKVEPIPEPAQVRTTNTPEVVAPQPQAPAQNSPSGPLQNNPPQPPQTGSSALQGAEPQRRV